MPVAPTRTRSADHIFQPGPGLRSAVLATRCTRLVRPRRLQYQAARPNRTPYAVASPRLPPPVADWVRDPTEDAVMNPWPPPHRVEATAATPAARRAPRLATHRRHYHPRRGRCHGAPASRGPALQAGASVVLTALSSPAGAPAGAVNIQTGVLTPCRGPCSRHRYVVVSERGHGSPMCATRSGEGGQLHITSVRPGSFGRLVTPAALATESENDRRTLYDSACSPRCPTREVATETARRRRSRRKGFERRHRSTLKARAPHCTAS